MILLDDQDRSLWKKELIAEGLALIDKAMRHRRSGPYQIQAAISALHARAARPEETDWPQIDLLYGALEIMQPSPVVTLNRAVAVSKVRGPQAALDMIEPLASRLSNYFHYFGVRGAFLMQLGRNDEARTTFDRAIALGQHVGGSRPHPHASRSPDARQPGAGREGCEKHAVSAVIPGRAVGRGPESYSRWRLWIQAQLRPIARRYAAPRNDKRTSTAMTK